MLDQPSLCILFIETERFLAPEGAWHEPGNHTDSYTTKCLRKRSVKVEKLSVNRSFCNLHRAWDYI